MRKNRKVFEPFNVAILAGIVVAVIIAALLVMYGCATTQPLTAKQRATVILGVYNAEYNDTMAIMSSPTSTPAQRAMGAKKKVILTQIWPLLKIYTSIVDGGGTPDQQTEDQLMKLINQLTTMATQEE